MDDLERFLVEDLGKGDITTRTLGIKGPARAIVTVNQNAVLAGLAEAQELLRRGGIDSELHARDGEVVVAGSVILEATGSADELLARERLCLNLIGRLSGIATLTRRTVEAARKVNPRITIAATRKTTPGLRALEKKAIVLGGGDPHRQGLYDAILIKDNHLTFISIEEAVERAKKTGRPIEIEADTLDQALTAARSGVDRILLDNFDPTTLEEAVQAIGKENPRIVLEASGGITPDNVAAYATTGVDVVSLGRLTTAAPWIDLSMAIEPD